MGEKRDEFVANLKKQLDEWNAKIDELEIRAKRGRDEAEVQADLGLAELRDRRDEMQRKLREIREAGENVSADLRRNVERARDELVGAFTRARARYEERSRNEE